MQIIEKKIEEISTIQDNEEIDITDYDDDNFEHECPRCGFKFNDQGGN